MRVLITGATGFLGGAVAHACVSAGMEVLATRRPTSRVERLAHLAGVTFFDASENGIEAALGKVGSCAAIIHSATCYGRHGESWTLQHETNTTFPLHLLEKALGQGVKLFLNIDTVLDPQINAYALSKRHFADWGRLATKPPCDLSFVNIRLEHVYGPGDHPSKFVTHLIRQCLANAEVIPLTEGNQRRDFIHVNDAVSGILKILCVGSSGKLASGWTELDLGNGQAVTIRELAETVHRLCGSHAGLRFGAVPYRPNEAMESIADTDFLKTLGWQCQMSLEEGLKDTIDFEEHR